MTFRDKAFALVLLSLLLCSPGCRKRPVQPPSDRDKAPPIKILYPTAPGSFVKLVERVKRSVVHLKTDAPVRGGPADWFPSATKAGPLLGSHTERMQRSLGSGVIIDADGTVLTNHHIIAKREKIYVRLPDGTSPKADVIGGDEKTDVALLKIVVPADVKLKPARLGDSDQLKVGEWVAALGNPFGLDPTISAGVVSAKERDDLPPGSRGFWGYLQTDAKINPGNSGGPLVNTLGEVVGICTADPEAQGVGFAIPINVIKKILPTLKREGKVVRAWVGIRGVPVTDEKAKEAGLKQATGALITDVLPRGPAERAGLRAGDIIISFDKKKVRNANDLPWLISLSGVGRLVPVEVWRDGKILSFPLKSERMHD